MNMTMKKILIAFLAAAGTASAATEWQAQEALDSKVDSINAKRGVQIGGKIRAVAQTSYLDTDNDPTGINKMPETERNEFANADIDFHFRPYEFVRVNAMLRLGAGMQEYFSSASKTMSVGWLNVEGNIGNSFYWVIGDFREQYSPLTLFSPDVEILYEPLVFSRKRHMAESQELLEGNKRNLQGANVQFRTNFGESVGEFRAEALAARLNRTSVLDLSGAEGNILPNDSVPGASLASNMDKWLLAANFELLPMSRNLYVGLTPMYIFDNEDSYSYTYRHPDNYLSDPYQQESINPYDTDPQKTVIVSGRVGADVSGFLGNPNLVFDLVAEYAYSSDDVYNHAAVATIDPTTGVQQTDESGNPLYTDVAAKKTLNGSALLVNVHAGYKTADWGAILGLDIVRNDSNWFNNVAQSPKFFARRILNTDKDGNTIKYGVNSPLYSTFDALYNYSPKYSPATTTLKTDDSGIRDGQTESYNIAPFNKSSWKSNVYSRSQLALIDDLTDPAVQLTLPNGLATSNRQGVRGNVTFNWSDFAEAQALVSYFSQVSPIIGYKEASYLEFGGGAKVDVFKIIGFKKPLELSGSYKHSERKVDTDNWLVTKGIADGTAELKSDFINAGLYVQYLPRLGFTAGLQYIKSDYNLYQGIKSEDLAPMLNSKQMQWMIGLDYSLAENAWLSLNFGIVSVSNEYNTSALVAQGSSDGAYNLPDYYDVSTDVSGKYKHEFSQTLVEASINVEF